MDGAPASSPDRAGSSLDRAGFSRDRSGFSVRRAGAWPDPSGAGTIDSFRRTVPVTVVLTVVFAATMSVDGGLSDPWLLALLALNTLPLLVVHRYPLAVVLWLCVAYPLLLNSGQEAHMLQSLPALVGLYVLGSSPRPWWWRAAGLVLPVWMLTAVVSGYWSDGGMQEVGYIAIVYVLCLAAGAVVAARRSYIRRLQEQTAALKRARRELAERAVLDERARIARELHDVIAHAMSVITVRAGVGAHLIDTRPAQTAEALRVIEHTGREALSELRRMLTVLREPDRTLDGAMAAAVSQTGPRPDPQPGLGDLPRLVGRMGEAGVVVTLTIEGHPRPLPAGLELAAYRVVQESLTNVAKHAPGARAEVTVRYLGRSLEVKVRNTGRVSVPVRPGQGLRGMTERVSLYDGQLWYGPQQDGFLVSAEFPSDGSAEFPSEGSAEFPSEVATDSPSEGSAEFLGDPVAVARSGEVARDEG